VNQYEIAIIGLLALEAITLFILWRTHLNRQFWQAMWTHDAAEFLFHKLTASRRDPKTGRFIKKDKI
jgi:hypothetical protein